MKLYTHPGSCSSAAHISLAESGLDFEIIKVDLRSDRNLPDGRHLSDVNPKGYVPALEHADGEYLTENVAILQYIADQSPDSRLAPANGTLERYHLQSWLGYVNSEVHKTIGTMFNPALPDEMKGAVLEKNGAQLSYINGHLADKDFLMGDQFTVADAYLFITLSWMPGFGVDLTNYPNIAAYEARIAERESVKRVKAA
jgi:glutathione S-transferase